MDAESTTQEKVSMSAVLAKRHAAIKRIRKRIPVYHIDAVRNISDCVGVTTVADAARLGTSDTLGQARHGRTENVPGLRALNISRLTGAR